MLMELGPTLFSHKNDTRISIETGEFQPPYTVCNRLFVLCSQKGDLLCKDYCNFRAFSLEANYNFITSPAFTVNNLTLQCMKYLKSQANMRGYVKILVVDI